MRYHLIRYPDLYAICRIPGPPSLPADEQFLSVVYSAGEWTLICAQDRAPVGADAVERDWVCFEVEGPFPFQTVGVLSALLVPLADAGVPVFVLSAFATDYILVKAEHADRAAAALRSGGHAVAPVSSAQPETQLEGGPDTPSVHTSG